MFGFVHLHFNQPQMERLFPTLPRDLRQLHCRFWSLGVSTALFAKSSETPLLHLVIAKRLFSITKEKEKKDVWWIVFHIFSNPFYFQKTVLRKTHTQRFDISRHRLQRWHWPCSCRSVCSGKCQPPRGICSCPAQRWQSRRRLQAPKTLAHPESPACIPWHSPAREGFCIHEEGPAEMCGLDAVGCG